MIFDLSPEEFFYTLVHTFTRFRRDRAKERTDLFYLIMGLNHLREWVAPGYRHSAPAKTAEEEFHNYIHDHCQEWKLLNKLCNGAKHDGTALETSVKYGLSISDWPSISGVIKFDKGPPSDFYHGTKNMIEIFEAVILFYQRHWFRSPGVDLLLNSSP